MAVDYQAGDEDDYIGDDESISYFNDGNDSLTDEDISSSPSYSNSPTRPQTKKTINTSHVVDDNEDLDDADILDRLGEDIDELIENDDRRDEDVFENVEGAIQIKQEKQVLHACLYTAGTMAWTMRILTRRNNHFYSLKNFRGVSSAMPF